MPEPTRRELLIALNAAPDLSRPAAYRLAQELDRWSGAGSPPEQLAAETGVPRAQMRKALAALETAAGDRRPARPPEAERLGARIVTVDDAGYPPGLRQLSPPPPVLYISGEVPAEPGIAIVGSRRADAYGREAADLFARTLAAAGVTVASGFAQGIDAAAHRERPGGSRRPDGRRARLRPGGGLPRGHARLAERDRRPRRAGDRVPLRPHPPGLALSAAQPLAGGADGRHPGGAGRPALGLADHRPPRPRPGRDVWAVPGRIFDEGSLGANALIREGAHLAQHPADLLETLLPTAAAAQLALPLQPDPATGAAPRLRRPGLRRDPAGQGPAGRGDRRPPRLPDRPGAGGAARAGAGGVGEAAAGVDLRAVS